MLESKTIKIQEKEFQLNPLKGFKALVLDKKIVSLLAPIIKGISSLDKEIDFGMAVDGISEALGNMPEAEYEKFVGDLLSTTIYNPGNIAPVTMSVDIIDKHFSGELFVIYELMFKVMEYNQFTPFVLVSKLGGGTITTLISKKLTEPTNESE